MALRTRSLQLSDLHEIKKIHAKYFSDMDFPGFIKGFVNAFIIEDENRDIILVGGLKSTAEGYLLTNKDKSNITIGRALIEAQHISLFTCRQFGITELFAFTHENNYTKHLIQHGFHEREGRILSLEVD